MSAEIVVISFLLLLNAFFALSEMAIVSASRPLLRHYAKEGKKSAAIALNLAENSGRFLSAVQVGITLVGTLAGAYGGATVADNLKDPLNEIPFIAPHGEALAVTLVVALITYFSVVIGELVPKQLALNNSEKWAMAVARPMAALTRICAPLVILLEGSAKVLLAFLRITPREEGVTETEIKAVIAEGVESGAIEDEEHDVIRRVIRLGDRDVKTIMTHRTDVEFVDVNSTLDDVREIVARAGHSRYPVIDKDTTQVLGIVRTKELLMAASGSEEKFSVRNLLSEMHFVSETTSCLEALNLFRTKSIHIAGVLDEYGSFDGLFTTSDLMEAIVGVLPSNYDKDEDPMIVKREDGSWLVDGQAPIEEIHMTIGLEEIEALPDSQTIAGFILGQMKDYPSTGESIEHSGYKFEIVDMDKHRIDKILIQRLPTIEG